MAILKEHWLDWLLAGVLAALLMAAPGCDATLPGFRFAATEEQQQAAQAGADLAGVLAVTGTPPGTPAARQAALMTRTAATYAGPPSKPIDLLSLLTPDVTEAWKTTEAQKSALATRDRVHKKTTDLLAVMLADIAAVAAEPGKGMVNADAIVPMLQASVKTLAIAEAITDEIQVPPDVGVSPEQAAARDVLVQALSVLNTAAAAQATRRPTAGEVATVAIDQGVGVLDELGLTEIVGGLLGTAGLGGLAVWLKGRSKVKQAEAVAAAATNGNGGAPVGADIIKLLTAALAATPPAATTPGTTAAGGTANGGGTA